MIKDTNPDHYKVDGANFIEYMNDPKIRGFGNWMFANGFNSGVWASSNWISVKDRLPPMEERVLVFCKSKSEHVHSVRTITEMSDVNRFNYKYKTEPYWREPWDFFYANYDITHWMPLPEPPKDGEVE